MWVKGGIAYGGIDDIIRSVTKYILINHQMMFPSQEGMTALIVVSKNNNLEVVGALVAAKADLNAKDNVGEGGHSLRRH